MAFPVEQSSLHLPHAFFFDLGVPGILTSSFSSFMFRFDHDSLTRFVSYDMSSDRVREAKFHFISSERRSLDQDEI